MKRLLIPAALLFSSAAPADDPPGIVWEREYDFPSIFYDVVSTSDGKIVCCGGTTTGLDLWCYDGEGDLLWHSGGGGSYPRGAARVISPPTGGYAVTGTCGLEYGSGPDLYVSRYDAYGTAVWNTALERPQSQDHGCDIAALPDGGFAVCGYTQDPILATQAWILRFDSAGDTLWTRTWGWSYSDQAIALEYLDYGITVLVNGRPQGSDYRPVLLRFDLAGNLVWTCYQDYSGVPNDLCVSPGGGYCLMRRPFEISSYSSYYHLNDAGGLLEEIPVVTYGGGEQMRRIIPTADEGCLVAGAEGYSDEPPATWNAHISRYDQSGDWMWTDIVQSDDEWKFHSAAQFAQGGYIAAGYHNTFADVTRACLVRFAPELGIQQPVHQEGLIIEACLPNPGSAAFQICWSSGYAGQSRLQIFDIAGRQRLSESLGLLAEGEHSTQIDLQELPSGCYLAVVTCGAGRASTKLVLLR